MKTAALLPCHCRHSVQTCFAAHTVERRPSHPFRLETAAFAAVGTVAADNRHLSHMAEVEVAAADTRPCSHTVVAAAAEAADIHPCRRTLAEVVAVAADSHPSHHIAVC